MINKTIIVPIILFLLFSSGCAGSGRKATRGNQIRAVDALPNAVAADIVTVSQFRSVCDIMARDLIYQPFISRSSRPPVIAIRKLQNKTGINIDEQIFQETIRVKLMENARGAVLFRDDESYKDIVQERVRQSSEEVTVTLTDSVVETKTFDRIREREFESGSLSGSSGNNEVSRDIEENSEMEMSQSATVKSRIAAADYFLRGIIFQVKEEDVNRLGSGMNYFQYQFRVVDARSGLIMWERMLGNKMEGRYTLPPKASSSSQGASSGQLPAGWPSGQGATGTTPPQNQGAGAPPGQPGQGTTPPNSLQQIKDIQDGVLPILQQIEKMK